MRVFFINQCNARFLTIGFSSDYSAGHYRLRGEVKQVFQNESRCLKGRQWICLQLLLRCNLERYRDKFPDKKDLQDKWKKAVTHPGKYVNLLVGQLDNEDLRVERDEENH